MKKKIALLGALGIAGGVLYALEAQHQRNKNAKALNEKNEKSTAPENGRSASDAKLNGGRQSQAVPSMARIEDGTPVIGNEREHAIDDQGTGQAAASQILRQIRDNAFEASDEKLAIALGRPAEEIAEWTSGHGLIDGDVILKARTLALQRGFEM